MMDKMGRRMMRRSAEDDGDEFKKEVRQLLKVHGNVLEKVVNNMEILMGASAVQKSISEDDFDTDARAKGEVNWDSIIRAAKNGPVTLV